jgi:TRAP-type mannitol/chloroaromatic compound transport system permease small subunit
MQILRKTHQVIDRCSLALGNALCWLLILMMVAICLVVLLRYGFDIGNTALQESVTYLHASIFMLGAAYTLKQDGHVRVDIFYRHFSPRTQAWVNSLGGIIFLLPLCLYIIGISWGFVLQSWQIQEVSPEPGGIPAIFLLKSLIPLMGGCLALQGFAEVLRACLVLIEDPLLAKTPRGND